MYIYIYIYTENVFKNLSFNDSVAISILLTKKLTDSDLFIEFISPTVFIKVTGIGDSSCFRISIKFNISVAVTAFKRR